MLWIRKKKRINVRIEIPDFSDFESFEIFLKNKPDSTWAPLGETGLDWFCLTGVTTGDVGSLRFPFGVKLLLSVLIWLAETALNRGERLNLKSRRSAWLEPRDSEIVSSSESSIRVENECCNREPNLAGSYSTNLPPSAICESWRKFSVQIKGHFPLFENSGLKILIYLESLIVCEGLN